MKENYIYSQFLIFLLLFSCSKQEDYCVEEFNTEEEISNYIDSLSRQINATDTPDFSKKSLKEMDGRFTLRYDLEKMVKKY